MSTSNNTQTSIPKQIDPKIYLLIVNSLINYINKSSNIHKGLKTTNKSYFITRYKLSYGILIQFPITEDISQYLDNQLLSHKSTQQAITAELKYWYIERKSSM